MDSPKEFNLIFYVLASIGLFHFFHDHSKHGCIRYLTFVYSLLRTVFAIINVIVIPVSLIISPNSVVERAISLFYTTMTAINCVYVFYLCTHGRKLNAFLRHWKTFRLTSEKCTPVMARLYVAFGIIFSAIPLGYNMYSSLIDTIKMEIIVQLHTGFIFKKGDFIFEVIKVYFFITMGILETLSVVFIPVFYLSTSSIIAGEFSTWNELLQKNIDSISFRDDITLSQQLKSYENICTSVRLANNFLSFYLGINLMVLDFNICFLLYVIITNWEFWGFLLLYVVYELVIIWSLIGGSGMINSKVLLRL